MNTPIIFLCFANEYHEGRYLDNLVKEYKLLYAALAPVSANENPAESSQILCEVIVRQNVTISDIVDVFQNKMYRGRIAIFHYGGHADGYQLLLEGKDGENKAAHGAGLVSLLSKQDSLKLVFLNGCSTQKMAQDLVARGVPAVIGTATSIADDVALNLAERFYKGLAQGLTLSGAWETAKDEVRTFMDSPSNFRSLYLESLQTVPDRFPWDIEYKDGAAKEVHANWNLPDVASQPLFGLPDITGKHQLPPSPFLFLKPYESQHAEIFFGRSYYIRDLYLKIAEPSSPPIILFYGESGAGKSSLLDAGLRPRLDAAKKADKPDELAFEVHYQRRNAEIGLVGTLSEMLSYTLETELSQETETPEADPNAAKIEEIEGIIDQLEGDDRQTLRSFIERHKAVRSVQGLQQKKRNLYEGGSLKTHTGTQLRAAWANIEAMTGRRLIIILDQVEETFARPHPDMPNELEDFLQVMKDIWATPEDETIAPIRGRIILGYREEFNARIEARIKDFALSRTTVFLEHLQRKDILDIFAGLQSEVVRQNYNVRIEKNLPERVADDLLKGRTTTGPGQSPVAPVLQLLLTKMWNKAYRENSHEPHFTLDAYNAVQSQGREMEEFFYEQLAKVYEWDADVVDTGLVLDILQYHVTDLGTSGRRHIDDMRSRYRHLAEVYEEKPNLIYDLVEKLKEVFLLVDNSRGFTSLPHDTLAPIVMREYNRSDKLGQRSTRILDTKLPDFEQADDKHKNKIRLDDNDLEVVEGGILGMRALSDTEYQLLEISRIEREKRLRLRRQLIQGGLVTGVIILLLALAAASLSVSTVSQLRKSAVSHAHEEAQELLSLTAGSKDPDSIAHLRAGLLGFAYTHDEVKRTDVIEHLYGLAHQDAIRAYGSPTDEEAPAAYSLRIHSESRIHSLDYQPKTGVVSSFSDGFARVYPLKGKPSRKFQVAPTDPHLAKNTSTDVRFTADGKLVQVTQFTRQPGSYVYSKMAVYNLAGSLEPAPLIPIAIRYTYPEIFDYDSEAAIDLDYLQYVDEDGEMLLGLYDCLSGIFTDYTGTPYTEGSMWSMQDRYRDYTFFNLISGDTTELYNLFAIRLWDRPRQRITNEGLEQFQLQLEAVGIRDAQQEQLVSPYRDRIQQADSSGISCKGTSLEYTSYFDVQLRSLKGDTLLSQQIRGNGLFYFQVLNESKLLALEPEGFSNRAIFRDNRTLAPLTSIAHEGPILDIGITGDKQHVLTFSENEAKATTFDGKPVYEVRLDQMRHKLSPDDSRLITYNRAQLALWSGKSGEEAPFYHVGNPELMQIVAAQFIPDDPLHLAIGLARKSYTEKAATDSVLYWNIKEGKVKHRFALRRQAALLNMKLSAGGNEMAAWVREGSGKDIDNKVIFRTREGVLKLRGEPDIEAEENEHILFSQGLHYIMLHNEKDDLVKVYNLSGEKLKTYELKQGFRLGFHRQSGVTPDDAYLFGHNANNALFWSLKTGDNEFINNWVTREENTLDFYTKQEYGLTSIVDHIPGHDDFNRNLSLLLLALALLYIIIRASYYLYTAFAQKDYQKAGLYGGMLTFFLLILLLMVSDTSQEEARLTLLSFTLIAALALAIPELIKSIRTTQIAKIAFPGLAVLIFGSGLALFNWRELAKNAEVAGSALAIAGVTVLVFSLCIVLPSQLSLMRRQQNRMAGFYYWQLPVIAVLAFVFWVILNLISEDAETPYPDLLLLLASLAGGIWVAVRQTRIYRKQEKVLALALYGTLAFLLLLFAPSAYETYASLPANIMLLGTLALLLIGVETARQKAPQPAFWLISAGLIALVGIGINAAVGVGNDSRLFEHVNGAGFMMVLFFLPPFLYGIRYFLNRSYQQVEMERSPWLPRMAAMGLGILLLGAMLAGSGQMEEPYDYADYDDDYYYYDEEGNVYYGESAYAVSLADEQTEPGDEPAYQEAEPAYEEEVESAPPDQPGTDDSGSLNDRQQHIVNMFSPEESTRQAAFAALLRDYAYAPELLPELIGYNYQAQSNEGIWNSIYLLERLPDDVLISQQELVTEYLNWTAQRGYGPGTMGRIEGIQLRIQ